MNCVKRGSRDSQLVLLGPGLLGLRPPLEERKSERTLGRPANS